MSGTIVSVHFDLPELIRTVGYLGIWAIVFAESGLLVGFFLPGDSLLFTAGFLASQGYLNIWILVIGCFIAAVVGDSVGYTFGHRYGRKLFTKEESLFFNPKHLIRAEDFYHKHGKKTIIIARFVPIVRTFAPIVAGMGKMEYRTFLSYNIIGALLWAVGVTLLGYYLGKAVPDIDKYLIPGIILIILLSVAQPLYHLFKEPANRALMIDSIRQAVGKNK